jgi:phosphoglycolate phosphatase
MHQNSIGVGFDLDGTLFDSCSVSKMALRDGFKAFWEEVGVEGPVPSWDEVSRHIGLPSYGFFPALLPQSHKDQWRNLHRHIGQCEKMFLESGQGLTFEGVHETLKALKDSGYFLGCLSNASKVYFDSVLDCCKLREYFDKLTCIGEFRYVRKADILIQWSGELGGKEKLVYVGDRSADIEEAHVAGLKAVGVSYGYGARDELVKAEVVIDKIKDLLGILPNLYKFRGDPVGRPE